MSTNTNFTCRDKYYSYGSYLRSRGYDKEICNLVAAIEAGQIVIGPITPGKCPSDPTTINNSVNINGCPSGKDSTTGILKVTGGNPGPALDSSDNFTSFLSGSTNFGIQSNTGIRNLGPIYSSTDCSHSNYFGAKFHIFDGGNGGDCSTNVIIRGNLLVDGSFVELGGFFGETLTLVTLPGNDALGTLNLFRSPSSNGNTMTVYNDTSDNILSGLWQTGLTFSIDGNLDNTTAGPGIDRIAGMTDTQGHVRSFRGITVSNPPNVGQPIDICYNRDISGSSYALQVYGDLQMNSGNNDASGNIDLSGGDINFYLNNNLNSYIHANGDASFNGHVTVFDLSVVNFAYINDLSVNDLNVGLIDAATINSSTINNSGNITTTDLSVVNFAYINDLSVNDLSAGLIDASTINSSIINNSGNITTTDLSVNTHASIYDLSVVNFAYINDLSVNDLNVELIDVATINSSTINNSGNITTTDLSVNTHASIYDLSVVNFAYINDLSVNDLNVGLIDVATINSSTINNSGNITTTDLSVNTHASIYDLSVVNFAYINDLSVNDLNVGLIDVATINSSTINNSGNITTTDLSVNTHASIYDLSVTNFMTIGTSTTTIDTNSINATSGYFNDISVNDLSVNTLEVESLEIANQLVLQDLSVNTHASIYDLSVTNFMTIGTSTTTIDTNSINATSGYFNDISVNDLTVNTLEIANQLVLQDLSVNTHASIYDLSVNNFAYINDLSVNALNTGDVSANNLYLKENLTLNGNITGTSGDLLISTFAGGDLRMTAGTFAGQFTDGDIIFERQNAKTTNKFGSTTRTLTNFGETISIIDISSNKPSAGYSAGQHDLSFSSILYSNIDNSTNLFSVSDSCIDFSNNQSIVGNSIWEMYFSVPAEFGNQSDSIAVVLSDKNSTHEIIIDTRSVGKESGFKTIVFGPQSFIFTPDSSDNSFIYKQWNVSFDICGGSGPLGNIRTQNGRLTMKQKSII